MFNMNMKVLLPMLMLASTLAACGGGSSVNNNVDDPVMPGTLKEGLPYSLDKSDGRLAYYMGNMGLLVRTVGGHLLPPPPDMVESVAPDKVVDFANPITVSSYLLRKCQTGSADYSDNRRPVPVRIKDPLVNGYTYHLAASNCALASDNLFDGGGVVDGVIDRTMEVSPFPPRGEGGNEITLLTTSEYTNYIYDTDQNGSTLDVKQFEENAVYLTGSSSHKEIRYANDDTDIIVDAPLSQYTTNSGDSLVIDGIFYSVKLSKSDGTTTEALRFNARWVMGDSDSGNKLIRHDEVDSLIFIDGSVGRADAGTFTYPKGSYDLRVALNSPLFVPPGKVIPTEGSITVNLVSHNIKADIVYHPTYADVTYTRNGVTELVQVDTGF